MRQGLSLAWTAPTWLGWLASKAWGSSVSLYMSLLYHVCAEDIMGPMMSQRALSGANHLPVFCEVTFCLQKHISTMPRRTTSRCQSLLKSCLLPSSLFLFAKCPHHYGFLFYAYLSRFIPLKIRSWRIPLFWTSLNYYLHFKWPYLQEMQIFIRLYDNLLTVLPPLESKLQKERSLYMYKLATLRREDPMTQHGI